MSYLLLIVLALISPGFIRLRRDGRAGRGGRHRNPGLARMAPAPRAGRHLLVRPDAEAFHADEMSW